MDALKAKFNTTATKVVEFLKNLGFKAEDIIEPLIAKFSLSLNNALDKLFAVGFKAVDFVEALLEKFSMSATQAVLKLKNYFAASPVMKALKDVLRGEARQRQN